MRHVHGSTTATIRHTRRSRAKRSRLALAAITPWLLLLAVSTSLAVSVSGCNDRSGNAATIERTAAEIGDHECSVCGMLVRDQPAPRGQLVHRDGTTAFTCSVGDLLVHLSAPSPHGRAEDVWVEIMTPTQSPAERATRAHPWVDADDAWYVLGVQRRGIMGPPILAYADRAHAESAAAMHENAQVVDRVGLEAWWSETHR